MSYSAILLENEGGVAKITLNRPSAFNAMNREMFDELLEVLIASHGDPAIRALVLTGSGAAFCAGGDVKLMAEQLDRDPAVFFRHFVIGLHAVISEITRMPKPVIAAINGVAAGAGFSLALATDLIVASDKARFTVAYSGIGLSPDGGATYFLPRLIGLKRTMELLFTNKMLRAEQALQMGLVNEVVPAEQLMAQAGELAKTLAAGPTVAFAKAKQLVYAGLAESLETQLENERQGMAETSLTADFRDGALAFNEKRTPTFTGR